MFVHLPGISVWLSTELLNLKKQISSVVKASFFQLRLLAKVNPYLPRKEFESVIYAFITSRLDYCNSLYVCLDQSSLQCLQLVQNAAARLLTGTKMYEHITPVLASLPGFLSASGLSSRCYWLFLRFYMGWHLPIYQSFYMSTLLLKTEVIQSGTPGCSESPIKK